MGGWLDMKTHVLCIASPHMPWLVVIDKVFGNALFPAYQVKAMNDSRLLGHWEKERLPATYL